MQNPRSRDMGRPHPEDTNNRATDSNLKDNMALHHRASTVLLLSRSKATGSHHKATPPRKDILKANNLKVINLSKATPLSKTTANRHPVKATGNRLPVKAMGSPPPVKAGDSSRLPSTRSKDMVPRRRYDSLLYP